MTKCTKTQDVQSEDEEEYGRDTDSPRADHLIFSNHQSDIKYGLQQSDFPTPPPPPPPSNNLSRSNPDIVQVKQKKALRKNL